MEAILVSLMGGLCIYLVFFSFLSPTSKDPVKQRLFRLTDDKDINNVHSEVLREKKRQSRQQNGSGFQLISRTFEDNLVMSGIRLNPKEYLIAWALSTLLPVLLILVINPNPISVVAAAAVGFSIPPFLVGRAKKKRQNVFNIQLGEALIVIGNSIRAGYSFQQALESIAADMQPPISYEFSRTLREMRYGVSLEDALNHTAARVNSKDLSLLVTAVVTSTQVGGNLSDIMDTIAGTIKDRIRIRNEVRVLTSTGRISGLVIGLLPVIITLILMVINPVYIKSFFSNSLGQVLLGIGVALEIIGFTVINKIVDLKY